MLSNNHLNLEFNVFQVVYRVQCDVVKSPFNVPSYLLAVFHISLFDLVINDIFCIEHNHK